MMIKAIIFDMDGTLVDSERLSIRAMAELIPEISISIDALLSRYGGQQLSKTFRCIENEFGCTLPHGFETQFRSRVAELIEKDLQAFEHVHETLAELTIPFCLATNAPRKKADHVLRKSGLDIHFPTHIFSAYEVGAWKPDPALFLHAAKNLNVTPEKCLVVEDSKFGLDAGKAAGMHVLEFCGPHSTALTEHYFRSYADFSDAVARL